MPSSLGPTSRRMAQRVLVLVAAVTALSCEGEISGRAVDDAGDGGADAAPDGPDAAPDGPRDGGGDGDAIDGDDEPFVGLGDLEIDPARIPDWSHLGVEGGIPDVSSWPTIDATSAAFGADPACDGGDDYDALSAAIEAAALAFGDGRPGTIVALPDGCYEWADRRLEIRSNVVLRGASKAGTRLLVRLEGNPGTLFSGTANYSDGGSHAVVSFHGVAEDAEARVESGFARRSLVLQYASAPGYAAGDHLWLREDWDPEKQPVDVGSIGMSQVVRVASVDGVTVTLDRELEHDFNGALDVRTMRLYPVENAGIERLTLRYTQDTDFDQNYDSLLAFSAAVNSWARDVFFTWGDQTHIAIGTSRGVTIESCDFAVLGYTAPTSEGGEGGMWNSASIVIDRGATDSLVWNNWFEDVEATCKYEGAPMRNGWLFNYSTSLLVNRRDMWLHGHYPVATLFEGNVTRDGHSEADNFWGQQGPRNTWFRNVNLGEGGAGVAHHEDNDRKIGDLFAYMLNVVSNAYSYPGCAPPDCHSFDGRQDGVLTNLHAEYNRFTGVFVRVEDQPTTVYVDHADACPTNGDVCDGFVGPLVRVGWDDDRMTGYDGDAPPSAWATRSFPPTLTGWPRSRFPFLCADTPWPAQGADVTTVSARLRSPAERRYLGEPCP